MPCALDMARALGASVAVLLTKRLYWIAIVLPTSNELMVLMAPPTPEVPEAELEVNVFLRMLTVKVMPAVILPCAATCIAPPPFPPLAVTLLLLKVEFVIVTAPFPAPARFSRK